MEALRGLVAHGFGVTVLSDMVFRPWSLEGKRIEARPILDAIPQMDAGMIWSRAAPLSAPAAALQQFLIHACGT
jgi:DNA-binding transcriptional LysR family regulator